MEWKLSHKPTAYPDALAFMEQRVAEIHAGKADECVWLLEHPPLYTGGTSAKEEDLIGGNDFPVYATGRGGEYTYHGPGQRIAYVMLNLKKRAEAAAVAPDLRAYVKQLEHWIIATLAELGVEGFTRKGRIGVWVDTTSEAKRQPLDSLGIKNEYSNQGSLVTQHGSIKTKEAKIAALGIRVRKWVSFHGISLNVCPDLSHYNGIVPCGISNYGVTSLHALGMNVDMDKVDAILKKTFDKVFE